MKKNRFLIILFLGLLTNQYLVAQQKTDDGDLGDAASNATNPLAFVTKLQFQPNYTWKDDKANQFSLVSRIIQPTPSIGLPFIKSKDPSKVYTLYRLEFPIVSQTFPENPSQDATGIGNIILLDMIAFKQPWGLLGVGPGLIIPTASSDVLGAGKWSAGDSAVALNTKTKGIQWGVLVQQYFSIGGRSDRPDKNFMLFQPIFNKILGKGFFLQASPTMTFDWKNDQYNIPISVALGKAFAKNLTMNIGPEYVVSGPAEGEFTMRLNLNTMFPPAKK